MSPPPPSALSERALSDGEERSRVLEPDVLASWFRQHASYLWRLVTRLGVAPQFVDDVVQEVFVLASGRHQLIQQGAERAFLRSVAIKLSANQRRLAHSRLEVRADCAEHEGNIALAPDQVLDQKRLRRMLDVALESLSPEQRAVFVLYELEGHTVPEIAQLLGLPLGTVSSRLGRGRQRFSRVAARLHAQLSTHEDGNGHV